MQRKLGNGGSVRSEPVDACCYAGEGSAYSDRSYDRSYECRARTNGEANKAFQHCLIGSPGRAKQGRYSQRAQPEPKCALVVSRVWCFCTAANVLAPRPRSECHERRSIAAAGDWIRISNRSSNTVSNGVCPQPCRALVCSSCVPLSNRGAAEIRSNPSAALCRRPSLPPLRCLWLRL